MGRWATLLIVLAARLSCGACGVLKPQGQDYNRCRLIATTYQPSQHEIHWTKNAQLWAGRAVSPEEFCAHVAPAVPDIRRWLALIQKLTAPLPPGATLHPTLLPSERHLFSHFEYTYDCDDGGSGGGRSAGSGKEGVGGSAAGGTAGGTRRQHRVPIEPLVGSLRHPLFHCDYSVKRDVQLFDRSYLLLARAHAAPFLSAAAVKVFVFDIGASTWDGGQSWFVEQLHARGFAVDAFYAWEVKEYSHETIYGNVPKWLMPNYYYVNAPAPTGSDDPGNPLNIIRRVARAQDYVLLKLDIDNTPTEMEFVSQLLGDRGLSDLVDEFLFEHHVNFQVMHENWQTQVVLDELHDTYRIFSTLRQRGVRAHGWI